MMKLFKSTLFAAAAALVASFTMVSCNQPTPPPPPPPMPDLTNATVLSQATSFYMGDEYNVDLAHLMTSLYSDGLTMTDGQRFTGSGDFVWLDFLTNIPADERKLEIATGVYYADEYESNFNPFTFYRGIMTESGDVFGSFCATVVDGREIQDPIVDGHIWISRTGNTYQFVVEVKTESGAEKLYKFEDTHVITNFGVGIPPDPFDNRFISADFQYFGDDYEVDFGSYVMELTTIPAGQYAAGYVLGLDINNALVASPKEIVVKTGTYQIDDTKTFNTPMTFNAGFGEGGGSYWLTINSEGGIISGSPIVDGEFTITDIGAGKHKVVASYQVADGKTYEATFEGVIPVNDATCLSRMDGDLTLNSFTKGAMVYRGDVEYFTNNADNWGIFLATDGIDLETMTGKGDIMQLDINTKKGTKLEPSIGRYSVVKKITNTELVPMTYIPGFHDNLRGLIGSWYRKDNLESRPTAPAVTGFIDIAKNEVNAEYTVTFDMHDDYYYANGGLGNAIKGSYSGKLKYIDATANMGQSAPAFAPFSVAPRAKVEAVVGSKRDVSFVDSRSAPRRR